MNLNHNTAPVQTSLLTGWRYRAVLFSVVGAALGYLGVSVWGGWREVMSAFGKVGWIGIGIALLLSCANYGLRFVRWQIYLRELGHPVRTLPSLRIYLAGFALTTTPGKAGEALRGLLLKRWGVPYPLSFAAFFSERLSDLLAVAVLTLFGLSLYPQGRPIIVVGLALVVAALLVLSQRSLLEKIDGWLSASVGKLATLGRNVVRVLLEARRCHEPRVLLLASVLSVLAWSAEALAFYCMLHWMGMAVPLAFAVFVYAIAMLAGALSFMPGGLGGAEVVMVALLTWKGMQGGDAVAATVLIRLTTLWFAVGLGAWFLLRDQSNALTEERP
jgi:uncharacterized protein (TIRG00374 family)